ncbi:response regulator transcription factor [Streptomyces] [Streptomyces violaceorubidus]
MAIRVLLVDDQPLLRTGFRMILEAEQDLAVVGEPQTAASAREGGAAALRWQMTSRVALRLDGVSDPQVTGPEDGRPPPKSALAIFRTRSMEYFTSSAVTGSPLANSRPSRTAVHA